MPKLFVANPLDQVHDFRYRVPEVRDPRAQEIPRGGQVQVSGDLRREDIEFVVGQHEIYGMVDASRVAQSRSFVTLLYAVDRPVSSSQMMQARERNLALKEAEGLQLRRAAALVASDDVDRNTPEGVAPRAFDITIEEKPWNDRDPAIVEQHYRPARAAPEPVPRGRGRRRAA